MDKRNELIIMDNHINIDDLTILIEYINDFYWII